jgi:hypothetical protein
MAVEAHLLSKFSLPEFIEIEVVDDVRGARQVQRIEIEECFEEVARLMASARTVVEALDLIEAMAKHRAVDNYMLSIGIDPHAGEH